jgi:hypothetical protein
VTAGPTALAGHPDVRAGLDLLAAWIEAQLAHAGVPGLSVGVVHDQELVWASAPTASRWCSSWTTRAGSRG